MKHPLRHALPQAVLAFALTACGGPDTAPPASSAHTSAALETRIVETAMRPLERDWDGVIEAVERATLAAQTGGRVAELHADVGDAFAKDQVLARFTAVEQQARQRRAQAELEAARANAAEAAAAFERASALRPEGAISRAVFDQARAAHEAAQAQLAAARAALREAEQQAGYTEVRAPFDGVIAARHVETGETVAPGSALFSLLSFDSLRLVVDVPQSQALTIANAQAAFVQGGDGTRIAAAKVTPFPQADAASHSVTLRLDLPKRENPSLRPGASAKAVFVTGQAPRIAVPDSALARRGEIASVFVVDASGIPALRQVRIGRSSDGETEVLAGLQAGETIALDALAALELRRLAASDR